MTHPFDEEEEDEEEEIARQIMRADFVEEFFPNISTRKEPLKKLTPTDLEVIALFLTGKKQREIGELVGYSVAQVSYALRSGPAKELIQEIQETEKARLKVVASRGLDVLSDMITDPNSSQTDKLRAMDRLPKLQTVLGESEQATQSAEDLVATILSKVVPDANGQINVQLNQYNGVFPDGHST